MPDRVKMAACIYQPAGRPSACEGPRAEYASVAGGAVVHMWAVGTQRCVFVPSPLVLHLVVVSIVGVLQQSRPLSSSAFISRSTPHYN